VRRITISGLEHDLAEGSIAVAVVACLVLWGINPAWVAGLIASPSLALVKFAKHRLSNFEGRSLRQHLKDGLWEALVFGAGWAVLLGDPSYTLLALGTWWLLLANLRRAFPGWASP